MIQKILTWETSDGKIFKKKSEAEAREAFLDLAKALKEDSLLGNYCGSTVNVDTLVEWLMDHKETVLNFLQKQVDND